MFITKFELNPARRGAARLLSSPQRIHAAVMSGFPPSQTIDKRILWRLDQVGHSASLYIVSPSEPDLTHLAEQAGWPTTGTWVTRSYQPLLERLAEGQSYGFRLTANPSHVTRVGENGPKKRLGHVTVEHQMRWLTERSEKLGIILEDSSEPTFWIQQRDVKNFMRSSQANPPGPSTQRSLSSFRGRVTITTATYLGTLTVKDPILLAQALSNGIGRAKAYGCGLMTLAPAHNRS